MVIGNVTLVKVRHIAHIVFGVGLFVVPFKRTWADREVHSERLRPVASRDLMKVLDLDALAVSPDGRHFAALVRKADVECNRYQLTWFIGATSGGPLEFAGDGGEVRFIESKDRRAPTGDLGGIEAKWSTDGNCIAYPVLRNAEIQLWKSCRHQSTPFQLTHHAANVRDFEWSEDGSRIYYLVEAETRQMKRMRRREWLRSGFGIREFPFFGEFTVDGTPFDGSPVSQKVWAVKADGVDERLVTAAEATEFREVRRRNRRALPEGAKALTVAADAVGAPIGTIDGSAAWISRITQGKTSRQLSAYVATESRRVDCDRPECRGTSTTFRAVWFSDNGADLVFQRRSGPDESRHTFYFWSPRTNALVELIPPTADCYNTCSLRAGTMYCLRETAVQPAHVVSFNVSRSAAPRVIRDMNPQLSNLQMNTVREFQYDLPEDRFKLGYPARQYARVILPPSFDSSRRHALVIAPYSATGFVRGDVGDEQPMQVYAANGFIVLNTSLPVPRSIVGGGAHEFVKRTLSEEDGFPQLAMHVESTMKALQSPAILSFVDAKRIGMTGLSQAATATLYMLQTHDILSAASVAGGVDGIANYYMPTPYGRGVLPGAAAFSGSIDYWAKINLADHRDAVEAPILFNLPDRESVHSARLIRVLDDFNLPFDAIIYPNEYHVKWQPGHRYAIYERNLDWFRFWLQDYEDPEPTRATQYQQWRKLRALQCRNIRSVRNYCNVGNEHHSGKD